MHHPRRHRFAAVVLIGALPAALTLLTPTAQASTPRRRAARFAQFVRHTRAVVRAETNQRVIVSVRILNAHTAKPATGYVWLVDARNARVSNQVRLSRFGWGTVSENLPAGTLPGSYAYRVRYGGSARTFGLISSQSVRFRVPMPPRDSTLRGTFADAPDVTNDDVGDVSQMPGYDPDYGNSWSQATENSDNWVYRTIASYHPGAFLITGDLVEGRWGNPANTSGLFGPPSDPARMLRNQAAFYHGENARRLEDAGLFDKTYPALGDHDIGDNPWGNGTPYGTWKREHLYLWRDAFNTAYLHHLDGRAKYFTHPVGTEWDKTAYATMINSETLLVTIDPFDRQSSRVGVHVVGAQLRWLDRVLATARHNGVRWIVVQGHVPVLPSLTFHSSGLRIAGGDTSPLWHTLVKYRVNLYLAGEDHATSRVTEDGVTQIVTGAPIVTGVTTFVTAKVYHDRMQFTIHGWNVAPNAPDVLMWQGGCSVPQVEATYPAFVDDRQCAWSVNDHGDYDYTGYQPTTKGTLSIYLDGRVGSGSGDLVPFRG